MIAKRGREFLLTPGPTNIPDRVLNAMHRPAIDFASAEFLDIARGVLADLKPVFGTVGEVFIYASNGHGAWEAALANVLAPGERILVPETGMFSKAWSAMAQRLGLDTVQLKGDWRQGAKAAEIEAALQADPQHDIKAVMIVHTDTATGITSDVAAVRQAIDAANHPALLMVDTIASLATVSFPMDDWGVDVAVAASQKGLMLPPGLGFTGASIRALQVGEHSGMPRSYWDWRQRQGAENYMWFCGTAPEHLVFGLREALDMIAEEGMEAVIQRHARLARATRACVQVWAEGGALEFNATIPDQRANSITCIRIHEDFNAEDLRAVCKERFQVALGGGFGPLHGRCFRIAHMGDINEPMLLGALASIEAGLKICAIPHRRGGIGAAIDILAS